MDKELWLSRLWDEWLLSPVKSQEQADSEVLGLFAGMRGFKTNRLKAARRLTGPGKFPLWPMTSFSSNHSLRLSMLTRPNHKPQVKFTITPIIKHKPSSTWSYLKGLWGTSGNLYFPKNGYYLSLSKPENFELPELSWNIRGKTLTLRNHDDITTFLYNTGMERAALEFEEMTIIRAARNRANLESNYDTANIKRTVRASSEQRRLAEEIISQGIFSNLSDKLKEIVELRLKYPDETLEGLGQKTTPPVSKSTVRYRWKKLASMMKT